MLQHIVGHRHTTSSSYGTACLPLHDRGLHYKLLLFADHLHFGLLLWKDRSAYEVAYLEHLFTFCVIALWPTSTSTTSSRTILNVRNGLFCLARCVSSTISIATVRRKQSRVAWRRKRKFRLVKGWSSKYANPLRIHRPPMVARIVSVA
jgi:hypothetical protein